MAETFKNNSFNVNSNKNTNFNNNNINNDNGPNKINNVNNSILRRSLSTTPTDISSSSFFLKYSDLNKNNNNNYNNNLFFNKNVSSQKRNLYNISRKLEKTEKDKQDNKEKEYSIDVFKSISQLLNSDSLSGMISADKKFTTLSSNNSIDKDIVNKDKSNTLHTTGASVKSIYGTLKRAVGSKSLFL